MSKAEQPTIFRARQCRIQPPSQYRHFENPLLDLCQHDGAYQEFAPRFLATAPFGAQRTTARLDTVPANFELSQPYFQPFNLTVVPHLHRSPLIINDKFVLRNGK